MPELKLYTVAQLREWLENNHAAEGLSEQMIAPTRGWAILHNPYVKDEDAIVAAIYVDGELAAYTASFPDMLEGKRVWWASTLYCYPKFTGKGYGLIVVGSLMEAHEPDLTYDRWAAKETVEIFHFLGLQTTYTKRYYLSDRKISTETIKGKFAFCAQAFQKYLHSWPKPSEVHYSVQYTSTIDDETYAFVSMHRRSNLWIREQKMLNWILTNPFVKSGAEETACAFGANAKIYDYKVAKIYVDEELQGVYVLRQHDDELSIVYLYYTYEKRDVVFDSIIDYIIANSPNSFVTENAYLYERVRDRLYFPKQEEENVSLSLPDNQQDLTNFTLQLGDGDNFA